MVRKGRKKPSKPSRTQRSGNPARRDQSKGPIPLRPRQVTGYPDSDGRADSGLIDPQPPASDEGQALDQLSAEFAAALVDDHPSSFLAHASSFTEALDPHRDQDMEEVMAARGLA